MVGADTIPNEILGDYTRQATTARIAFAMPEADEAISELESRRGELFCEFGAFVMYVGTIPADGPVLSFEERHMKGIPRPAAYSVLRHDGATRYGLAPTGRGNGLLDLDRPRRVSDPIERYLGHISEHRSTQKPLPHGPTTVETSTEVDAELVYDLFRDRLVIGTRAVGAFALRRAQAELRMAPNDADVSLGLLIAAQLEESGADWRPHNRRQGRMYDQIIGELKEQFIDRALVPASMQHLKLSDRTQSVAINSIGNRLPLFGMTLSDAQQIVTDRINERIDSDRDTEMKLTEARHEHGFHGDFEAYLTAALNNFLKNRLGLTDSVD